jgi:glucan phosphoethanolaminetransferase (alkaline phosphatase superfamily)
MERPSALTALGIINIVYGCLTLMCCTPLAISFVVSPEPALKEIYAAHPGLVAWGASSTCFSAVAHMLLVVAGIGLLLVRNWGRVLSIAIAVYSICASCIGAALMVIYSLGPIAAQEEPARHAAAVMMTVGAFCGAIVYPIVLLIFMFNKKLVAALKAHDEEPPPPPWTPPSYPPQTPPPQQPALPGGA